MINEILLPILTAAIALIVRELFALNREKRNYLTYQYSNLDKYYFNEYLSSEIKECRRIIEKANNLEIKDLTKEKKIISRSLQRIGVMSYLGSIPLHYSLMMNSNQIISDWLYVKDLINDLRYNENQPQDKLEHLHYHRRNAEWLALINYMWLRTQNYVVRESLLVVQSKFKDYYENDKNIIRREKILYDIDKKFVSEATKNVRKNILKEFKKLL